jgi:hypothetical protein
VSTTTTRTIEDRAGAVCRMLEPLARDIGYSDPSDLLWLVNIGRRADQLLGAAVRCQRDMGYNDGEIAEALGVTRQAVSKRWPGGGRYVGAGGRYRDR